MGPTGFVVKPIFQGEGATGKEVEFWKAMWSAPLITTTPAGAIKEDDFATAQTAFNQKLNDAANPPTQATQVAAVAPQTPVPVPTKVPTDATQPPITSALDA